MTFEQASQIYYINKEIKAIQKEIADLEGSRTLEEMLNCNLIRLQQARMETERFIQSIKDTQMRLIVRLRCVNNMNWQEIGTELGIEPKDASEKFYKFWEEQETKDSLAYDRV